MSGLESHSACDFCFLIALDAALDPKEGFDFVLRCPFLIGFAFTGLSLSLIVGEAGFVCFAPLLAASMSNTALRKSGSPKSSDSSFRSPAAPSRRAWLVFSIALRSPMSDQRPVTGFFSRNRPGGLRDRTASTIDREIDIFCLFVLVT